MHLYYVPMLFVLVGLVLYVVLGGADFGAGIWQLVPAGERAHELREHAHEAMAPVWEANHVWLIFVITVLWTAYPQAFGSIASTLSVPLFAAAVGIVLRGASYALRAGTRTAAETRRVDTVFALSSLLTPFALGTVVGAIADGRVPVGNAAGALVSSWATATSLTIGALAVLTSAYLAAEYLSADAVRRGEAQLERDFRVRALVIGVVAGAAAVAGLVVLRADVHGLYSRLLGGWNLAAVVVSALAGLATLALVWRRRYEPARYSAALAVAAIVAGWAAAQQPRLLPGLSIRAAAAPQDTLVAVVVAVLVGGLLLFPSLAVLFRLTLGGRLGDGPVASEPRGASAGGASLRGLADVSRAGLGLRGAIACLLAGFVLLTLADASWAHAVGVVCLLAFVPFGFAAVAPMELAAREDRRRG